MKFFDEFKLRVININMKLFNYLSTNIFFLLK
jgi:hypothetical protein